MLGCVWSGFRETEAGGDQLRLFPYTRRAPAPLHPAGTPKDGKHAPPVLPRHGCARARSRAVRNAKDGSRHGRENGCRRPGLARGTRTANGQRAWPEGRAVPDAGTPACRRPRRPRSSSPCCASAEPACQTPAESTGDPSKDTQPPTPRSAKTKGRVAPFLIKRIGESRKPFLKSKVEVRGHCLLWWLRHIPVRGTTHISSQEHEMELENCPEGGPKGTADTRRSLPHLNKVSVSSEGDKRDRPSEQGRWPGRAHRLPSESVASPGTAVSPSPGLWRTARPAASEPPGTAGKPPNSS